VWFAYDGGHIALRFDGNGSLTGRYLHGEAVDQIFAEEVGGQTRWTLTDHLGSVRDVVSDTGVTLGRLTYDSFGQVANTTGIVDTLFRYTGRPSLASTGFYDYRARTYDPRVGQFLSEDPIGFTAGDPNLRRYVGNEPTRYTDPSGMERSRFWSGDEFFEWFFYDPNLRRPIYSDSVGSGQDITHVRFASPGALPTQYDPNLSCQAAAAGAAQLIRQLGANVANQMALVAGSLAADRGLSKFAEWLIASRGFVLGRATLNGKNVLVLTKPGVNDATKEVAKHWDDYIRWVKTLPKEAHHIMTRYGANAKRMQDLFKGAGIHVDLDKLPLNKIDLPGHCGSHIQEYHDFVYREVKEALSGKRGKDAMTALDDVLKRLREMLDKNPRLPYSDGGLRK
jgi:RHS repeat-associated protein